MKGAIISEPSGTIPKLHSVAPSAGRKNDFLGIQALRGIAAILVVITHATYLWIDHTHFSKPAPWDNGTVGVDIFFVISGFVMMTSSNGLSDRKHPARVFLWRRFVRIAPLYWLLTSVKLLLIQAKPDLALHSRPSPWNIASSYLFWPSYGTSGEIRPVLPVGWTLNFEMFFYALFAIALAARIRVLYVLIPILGLLAIAGIHRAPGGPAFTAFADPIVLDFVAGVLIARSLKAVQSLPLPVSATASAIAILEIMLLPPHSSASLIRVLTYGCGATAIVGATIACEPYLKKILPRWILHLGDASYSIYLVQSFALAVVGNLLLHVGFFRSATSSRVEESVCVLTGVAASILLALPMYHFIELPLTRQLKRIKLANM